MIYTLMFILRSSMVLFCVLQDSGPFCPCFDPSRVHVDSLRMLLSCYAHERKKEQKNDEIESNTVCSW